MPLLCIYVKFNIIYNKIICKFSLFLRVCTVAAAAAVATARIPTDAKAAEKEAKNEQNKAKRHTQHT